MFNFTKAFWIPLGVGTGTLATGAGLATGIILPKALKAKNALGSFVTDGGGSNSLKGKNKINYVALGDSETAGYNGLLKRDVLSYADFLAGSLKKAGKLGKYDNLALSGERLADFKKDIFQYPDKVRELHDADLITLTLGANDVLAYMKILNIPFHQAFDFIGDPGKIEKIADKITKYNQTQGKYVIQKSDSITDPTDKAAVKAAEDALASLKPYAEHESAIKAAKDRESEFGNNPNLGISKEDSLELFTVTVDRLSKILSGTPQALLNLDKDWYPKIFDLITREYATLIRDLHKAAPKAQIRVLGHAFPFSGFPKSVIENKKDSLNGDSLSDGFSKMLAAIEKGAKTNLKGESKFVKFENINNLTSFKSKLKPLNPAVDLESPTTFMNWVKDNPMPNITDIHPSIYGQDLIGEDLYKDVAAEMGNIKNISGTTQHSNDGQDATQAFWARKDEIALKTTDNLDKFFASSKKVYGFANMGNSISKQKTIKPIIKGLLDYIKKPSLDGSKESFEDILAKILPKETKAFIADKIIKFEGEITNPEEINIAVKDLLLDNKKFIKLIKNTISKIEIGLNPISNIFAKALYPNAPSPDEIRATLGPEMIKLIDLKNNITDFVNDTKIIAKQLNDGLKDKNWSNENQWTIAQVGLAKLFKQLFVISSALSSTTTP